MKLVIRVYSEDDAKERSRPRPLRFRSAALRFWSVLLRVLRPKL